LVSGLDKRLPWERFQMCDKTFSKA